MPETPRGRASDKTHSPSQKPQAESDLTQELKAPQQSLDLEKQEVLRSGDVTGHTSPLGC